MRPESASHKVRVGTPLWHFHNKEHGELQHCKGPRTFQGKPAQKYRILEAQGVHLIDKPKAVGHGRKGQPVLFQFRERGPKGWWVVESGQPALPKKKTAAQGKRRTSSADLIEQILERLTSSGKHLGTVSRVAIEKAKLPLSHIESLGFRPSRLAIPERGRASVVTWRHPITKLHLHDHKTHWVAHQDKRRPGLLYGVTEGIPAWFARLRQRKPILEELLGREPHAKTKTATRARVKGHYRKSSEGPIWIKTHEREYAPGIPDKDVIKPIPNEPGTWKLGVQEHHADRAGQHLDLRLVHGGDAHSWAIRRLPDPGESVLAVQQPLHTAEYSSWAGTIPAGTYGAGEVRLQHHGDVHVSEADDNKVVFTRFEGKKAHEYVLIRPAKGGKNWILLNRSTTPGKYDFPQWKPKYKAVPFDIEALSKQEGILQPKVDGAHAIALLQSGKRPRIFGYRESKRGDVLEYTHKIEGLYGQRVPKGVNAVLRAEVFLVDKEGKALPAEQTAGVLNAGIEKARLLQKATGGLRVMPFDLVLPREVPYPDRLQRVRQLAATLPYLLPVPTATTPEEKQQLLQAIQSGKHPLTREGVVSWNGRPTKAKIIDEADVYVREIFPGKGKHKGRAGGFTYARTPHGHIVGKVGTGLSDELRGQLWQDRDELPGRVARIAYRKELPSGALFAPSFQGWHVEKNL